MTLSLVERVGNVRKAGYVKRFHTVQTIGDSQTVGAHSWGVATLINEVWPEASKSLLLAALYHDVAEVIIGDIPATTKWAYPAFAEAVARAEEDAERKLELVFVLTEREKRQLKICDMLELVLYSHEQLRLGNHNFEDVRSNGITHLHNKYGYTPEYNDIKKVLATI